MDKKILGGEVGSCIAFPRTMKTMNTMTMNPNASDRKSLLPSISMPGKDQSQSLSSHSDGRDMISDVKRMVVVNSCNAAFGDVPAEAWHRFADQVPYAPETLCSWTLLQTLALQSKYVQPPNKQNGSCGFPGFLRKLLRWNPDFRREGQGKWG